MRTTVFAVRAQEVVVFIVYDHGPGSDDDARDRGPGLYAVYSYLRGRRECVLRTRRIRCAWSVARDRRARSLMRTERVRPTDRTFYTRQSTITLLLLLLLLSHGSRLWLK